MKKLHDDVALKFRRRELKRKMTRWEHLLWASLRAKKLGFRFYRQHSIGPHVVDFYCPKAKLIIELDGKHHLLEDVKEYDTIRSDLFAMFGLTVLRFLNSEIDINLYSVLNIIQMHLPLLFEEGLGEK